MRGFDPQWKDLPGYILGITKEIWEDRAISSLHRYYGPDMVKRAPNGVVVGAQAVIDETVAALAAHPDILIHGEDVIWAGDEDAGFLSSHRVVNLLTRTAEDGRSVRVTERVIADCYCIAGQITDEWLIFDRGATARQLGLHPKEAAAEEIARQGGPDTAARPFIPSMDRPGPYTGHGNDNEWGQRYVDLLERVVAADFAALPKIYDRAVQMELPGGATRHGVSEADRFWLSLRAALPSARLEIQHVIGREDPLMPPRAAVRWALRGKHEGSGLFGEPTGADLFVWGISHAEFGPWGLRRDYILMDEVQIWKQILLA